MVDNRIRVKCAEAGISQGKLAEKMPDGINGVAMSFISSGKVLPTPDGLAKMREVLNCGTEDIYPNIADIDLIGAVDADEIEVADDDGDDGFKAERAKRSHDGMARFHAWLRPSEKEELKNAVAALGYRDCAEWLRDMLRQTVQRCIALRLGQESQGDDSRDT